MSEFNPNAHGIYGMQISPCEKQVYFNIFLKYLRVHITEIIYFKRIKEVQTKSNIFKYLIAS